MTLALTQTPAPMPTADESAFNLAAREASALSKSELVPEAFQNKPANCLLAIELARRLGASAFMVMQNCDVIHGRTAMRATFLIAMVNASKRFAPLRFLYTGEGDERACYAVTRERETNEPVEGPAVSIAMAKAEGWATKSGSKWKTMPDLMLAYRAGAFFSRLYASDVTLGMHTSDEIEDMGSERWEAAAAPSRAEIVREPLQARFDAALTDGSWSKAQRTSLATRWSNGDADARLELVLGMEAQLAPRQTTDDDQGDASEAES